MSPDERPSRFEFLFSIRARITIAVSATIALVFVAIAALMMRSQESTALAMLDEILSDEAEAIGLAVSEGGTIPALFDDDRVAIAIDDAGEVIAFVGTAAPGLVGTTVDAADDRGITISIEGQAHRVVDSQFITDDGIGHVLLAEPLDEQNRSVTDLGQSLRWTLPITVAVLAVIVWLLVGLALRPHERMRRTIAGIGIRELDRRVDVPRGGDEVTRLALTLNHMLSQLESAIRRRQRFLADASHELRTPLARMRAEAEADALSPDDADPERTLDHWVDEITGLQKMVDDVLLLSRHDFGAPGTPRAPVDLDDLVLDEVRALRPWSDVSIDLAGVSAAQVTGSADELRRVVRNLIDNAVRHATSRVAITLREGNTDDTGEVDRGEVGVGEVDRGEGDDAGGSGTDAVATRIVDDDGPGIPDERRIEVFERFRHLDPQRVAPTRIPAAAATAGRDPSARVAATGTTLPRATTRPAVVHQGAGLGLAIVAEITTRHHGTVTIADSPLGGARFILRLPLNV